MACVQAQTPRKTDSLLAVIRALPGDSSKVIRLTDLAYQVVRSNPRQAQNCAEEALGIAEDIAFPKGMAQAYNALGASLRLQGMVDDALANYIQALQICNKQGHKREKAAALFNIGNLMHDRNDTAGAALHFQQSLALSRELGDSLAVSRVLNGLGNIASRSGDAMEAIRYYMQAEKIVSTVSQSNSLPRVWTNIAMEYTHLHNYEKALEYCQKALELYKKLNDIRGLAHLYLTFAQIAKEQQHPADNLRYCQLAVEQFRLSDTGVGLATGLTALGEAYAAAKLYAPAQKAYEEALSIAGEVDNQMIACGAHNALARLFLAQKSLPEALTHGVQGMNIARLENDHPAYIETVCMVAEIYLEQRAYPEAEKLLTEALPLSQEREIDVSRREQVFSLLISLYKKTGNAEKQAEIQAMRDVLAGAAQR